MLWPTCWGRHGTPAARCCANHPSRPPFAASIPRRQDTRFRASKRTYDRQYAQLYFSRLMLLKDVMHKRVEQLWRGVPGREGPCEA